MVLHKNAGRFSRRILNCQQHTEPESQPQHKPFPKRRWLSIRKALLVDEASSIESDWLSLRRNRIFQHSFFSKSFYILNQKPSPCLFRQAASKASSCCKRVLVLMRFFIRPLFENNSAHKNNICCHALAVTTVFIKCLTMY